MGVAEISGHAFLELRVLAAALSATFKSNSASFTLTEGPETDRRGPVCPGMASRAWAAAYTQSRRRGEFINAWNHITFGAPNTGPTSTAFGTVASGMSFARQVQVGVKLIY